jgi:hypothetical protein
LAVSRRKFLHHGALVAAACAASPFSALASQRAPGDQTPGDQIYELSTTRSSSAGSWPDQALALQGMDRALFLSAVGTSFKALSAPDAQPAWLTLLAVEDLPRLAEPNPASFAVANKKSAFAPASSGFVLRFGSSAQMPQGSYLFQHDNLGSFALFTVPGAEGQTCNAIVNRLDAATIVAVPRSASTGNRNAGVPSAGITGLNVST